MTGKDFGYKEQNFHIDFNDIRNKTSLVDVLSDYIEDLQPNKQGFIGTCPFEGCSNEMTIKVNPKKKVWYCSNCHTGGDVLSFYAKIENLTIVEAAEELDTKY